MRAGIEARASCWWVQRLFNMSTITREWVALQHAHLMPFRWERGGGGRGKQGGGDEGGIGGGGKVEGVGCGG